MNKRETDLNETETDDISNREFKIIVTKIFTEVGRTMHEQSEIFNKEIAI